MQMRTSKPGAGNKFYITKSKGGYSTCIQGNPTDSQCNVLANCVGYACGRFNEIIGSMKYPSLNCNAENFIERARNTYGLEISPVPTLGGIMVWQKGSTLSGNDGAGHVAVVEKIIDSNTIYTSESGYGSSAFWNSTRKNTNGRWGAGSGYTYRGCIVNPNVKEEPKPVETAPVVDTELKIGNPVERDKNNTQIEVLTDILRVRDNPNGNILGYIKKGLYNVLNTKKLDDYLWCEVEPDKWIAYSSDWAIFYEKEIAEDSTNNSMPENTENVPNTEQTYADGIAIPTDKENIGNSHKTQKYSILIQIFIEIIKFIQNLFKGDDK